MSFTLHPQLEKDTFVIGDLPLCRMLLMNNRQFPWLILVPRRDNIREIFELSIKDYALMTAEMRKISERFGAFHKADKMNVAALGNMVPQLHIHIIARFKKDTAWPNPVWGTTPVPYSQSEAEASVSALQKMLNL